MGLWPVHGVLSDWMACSCIVWRVHGLYGVFSCFSWVFHVVVWYDHELFGVPMICMVFSCGICGVHGLDVDWLLMSWMDGFYKI